MKKKKNELNFFFTLENCMLGKILLLKEEEKKKKHPQLAFNVFFCSRFFRVFRRFLFFSFFFFMLSLLSMMKEKK
jgi:hypothetical protein